jgi:hypothetical protein
VIKLLIVPSVLFLCYLSLDIEKYVINTSIETFKGLITTRNACSNAGGSANNSASSTCCPFFAVTLHVKYVRTIFKTATESPK